MKILALLILLIQLPTFSYAFHCPGIHFAENTWVVTLGDYDLTNKSDIIESLEIIGTHGFSVKEIVRLEDRSLSLLLKFRPSAYLTEKKADEVKVRALENLLSIEGNQIKCVKDTEPPAANPYIL